MLKIESNKRTRRFLRNMMPFFLIGMFIVGLPISMYVDKYFPQINLPYIVTFLIFLVIPLYFSVKVYFDDRNREEENMNNPSVQDSNLIIAIPVKDKENDYGRDVFMGFFTFIFISFLNHALREFGSSIPANENYVFSIKTLLPGLFISLFFFRNAYEKYTNLKNKGETESTSFPEDKVKNNPTH